MGRDYLVSSCFFPVKNGDTVRSYTVSAHHHHCLFIYMRIHASRQSDSRKAKIAAVLHMQLPTFSSLGSLPVADEVVDPFFAQCDMKKECATVPRLLYSLVGTVLPQQAFNSIDFFSSSASASNTL